MEEMEFLRNSRFESLIYFDCRLNEEAWSINREQKDILESWI